MTITLAVGATSINLHADLFWEDEFSWQPVEQTAERTLTGGLVVSSAQRDKGRPITLRPESDNSAWMTRATVEQLRNWATVAGQQMQLTIRGVVLNVIWRHQDQPALDAKPVIHYDEMVDSDNYLVTLRLMEI